MSKTITGENVIECCNCSDDVSYEHCIRCEGKCYYDYMKLVCSKCKIYCKDISNMRNVNNDVYKKDINVCIKCFDETNIPKCYNNNCGGKFVLPICCKMDGYNYAMACKKCSKEDWIKQYCDMCR